MNNIEDLKGYIKQHNKNYIFGAGAWGTALCECLQMNGVTVDGFIVTDKESQNTPPICLSVPLYQADEISELGSDYGVIFGIHSKYRDSVKQNFVKLGYSGFLEPDDLFLQEVSEAGRVVTDDLCGEFSPVKSSKSKNCGTIENILLIRLDGIGDLILTTPLIRELHRQFPSAKIDMVVAPYVKGIISACPYINRVICFNWKQISSLTARGKFRYISDYINREIPDKEYDLSIVPRWDIDVYGASIISFLSGADIRIGYSENVYNEKSVQNKGYDKLYTKVLLSDEVQHEVLRNLDIMREMGWAVSDDVLEVWEDDYSRYDLNDAVKTGADTKDHTYLALGICAGAPKRIWDVENYISFINMMQADNLEYRFILMGGGDAVSAASIIEEKCSDGIINLVGRLTLEQNVSVFRQTKAYIGSDTGLMHMAAATGNLVFEISSFPKNGDDNSSNSIKRFGPWKAGGCVFQPETGLDDCKGECCKDYAHCINQITVEEVYKGVMRCLRQEDLA